MPDDILMKPVNSAKLQSFLSDRTSQVLMEGIDFDYDRLRSLCVEIDDISDLEDFPAALAFVAENGLYRISLSIFDTSLLTFSTGRKLRIWKSGTSRP